MYLFFATPAEQDLTDMVTFPTFVSPNQLVAKVLQLTWCILLFNLQKTLVQYQTWSSHKQYQVFSSVKQIQIQFFVCICVVGVEMVYVHVHRHNTAAQEMYKKIGFEVLSL